MRKTKYKKELLNKFQNIQFVQVKWSTFYIFKVTKKTVKEMVITSISSQTYIYNLKNICIYFQTKTQFINNLLKLIQI